MTTIEISEPANLVTWVGILIALASFAIQFPLAFIIGMAHGSSGGVLSPEAQLVGRASGLSIFLGPLLPAVLMMRKRATTAGMWLLATALIATPILNVLLLPVSGDLPPLVMYALVSPFYIGLLIMLAQLVLLAREG